MARWKKEQYVPEVGDIAISGGAWIARPTNRVSAQGERVYAVLHPKTGGVVDHMTADAVERNRGERAR